MVYLLKDERIKHLISNELATFIKHDLGSCMTLSDITQEISKYCHKHKLQNPKDGRTIIPDDNLRRLFNMEENETVNYFGIHRVISKHYIPGPIYFDYKIPMELANKNCLLFKHELLAFAFLKLE